MSTRISFPSDARSARRRGAGTRRAAGALLALGAVTLTGCFDKPKIEERWTRVDVVSSSLSQGQMIAAGAPQSIHMQATVTYRALLTGYAVAELRVADSLGAAQLQVAPDAPRVPMAQGIDAILAHSRSLGRATRAVTGWDHLIMPLDLSFGATADSAAGSRLFLLCYLGSGRRIELDSGADSVLITPFVSSERQVLPVGMELQVGSGTP